MTPPRWRSGQSSGTGRKAYSCECADMVLLRSEPSTSRPCWHRGGNQEDDMVEAGRFLDSLIEFMGNAGDLTDEELRDELIAEGVDVDALIDRVKKIVGQHSTG
jgi:hypothetical protein